MGGLQHPMLRLLRALLLLLLIPTLGYIAYVWWLGAGTSQASTCRGDVVRGALSGGARIPYAGENFRAYSFLGFLAGRTFVHSAVRDTMRDAYAELAKTNPGLRFVYAESGWPWGGPFPPHKTHANGTAVDFMVPVRSGDGQVSEVPTHILNQFGYGLDFDRQGRSGDYTIDFEAMALHLSALEKAAKAHGIRVQAVIFDGPLQPKLFATPAGAELQARMRFVGQAWIRHDEHYHVNFAVPCR